MNILFFLTPKENVAHIDDNDTLRQAIEKMEHRGFSAIPILTQDGKYIGTVTEGDLLWYLKNQNFPSLREMEEHSIMNVTRRRDNEAVIFQFPWRDW